MKTVYNRSVWERLSYYKEHLKLKLLELINYNFVKEVFFLWLQCTVVMCLSEAHHPWGSSDAVCIAPVFLSTFVLV